MRAMISAGRSIAEETGPTELRRTTVGSRLDEIRNDNQLSLTLRAVKSQFHWKTGACWEKTQTVYDIEVDGTHNYFANGVLVSNSRWSAIKLHEPMLNPAFEEPARRLLGMTVKQMRGVISGEMKIGERTGPSAIASALKGIDLDKEIAAARDRIQNGNKGQRDAAIRRLGYLMSAKQSGVHPGDWVLRRAPVLPPAFRPVSVMGNKNVPLVADANFLYKELFEANQNLQKMSSQLPDSALGNERLAVYDAFKAVVGLGDPITQQSKEKDVRGLLKGVFGHGSPKYSFVQRKLLSKTVDNVGRAVLIPNPELDMDTVGLPEDKAFTSYERYVVRRLRRDGMPLTQAVEAVRERKPIARQALIKEMESRPVIVSRAPTLHRYGIMAFRPTLTAGESIQMSPLVFKGFGADADGDMMNYHVPATDDAVRDASERMMPSRQLLSASDFKTPMHRPQQEFVGGLYELTRKDKGDPRRPAKPVLFRSRADVIAAWKAGEIDASTPVEIR